MYTDVIAPCKKYVNTQYEHQSSEEFAQLSSVGMEAAGWEAADLPSVFCAGPRNTGICRKSRGDYLDPSFHTGVGKLSHGEGASADCEPQNGQQPDSLLAIGQRHPSRHFSMMLRQTDRLSGRYSPSGSWACVA